MRKSQIIKEMSSQLENIQRRLEKVEHRLQVNGDKYLDTEYVKFKDIDLLPVGDELKDILYRRAAKIGNLPLYVVEYVEGHYYIIYKDVYSLFKRVYLEPFRYVKDVTENFKYYHPTIRNVRSIERIHVWERQLQRSHYEILIDDVLSLYYEYGKMQYIENTCLYEAKCFIHTD